MKKFSKITNQKVGEEPKLEIKLNDEDIFKSKLLNLMEQFLTIRTYGPVDRYQRAGTIKITGQELFIEALMNIISEKSIKEQAKLLENLKSSVKDWKSIDNKLVEFNNELFNSSEKNEMIKHKRRLISIYNNYKDDEEMLLKVIENSSNKIKVIENANIRLLASRLIASEGKYPSDIFNKISGKFENRINHLTNSL